jgi:hypothetical protein
MKLNQTMESLSRFLTPMPATVKAEITKAAKRTKGDKKIERTSRVLLDWLNKYTSEIIMAARRALP